MKKVLVSGYIGFNNFGDEIIFDVLSKHLKTLGYKVSALSCNPAETKKLYDVEAYYFKNIFQILKAIIQNNILISGGGSLLQNKTSNFSLFYYLGIIFLAKIFFKKVIIFAQGIEPIRGKFQEFITKNILKTTDLITVRDENSKNLLKNWGIKSELLSDPAYSIIENININQEKNGLIVQLRKTKGVNNKFIKDLAYSISRNYMGDIKVLSLQNEYDEKVCLAFVEAMKRYDVQTKYIPFENVNKTIELINNAQYIISTRLHGLIIANTLKTQNFALIYDEKVKTLCDELNIKNIDINKKRKFVVR